MSKNEGKTEVQKPVTYSQIKILGIGSFGKAYLVECNNDKVKIFFKFSLLQ